MTRAQNIALLSLFLLIIFAVPISQAVIDVKLEDEPKPFFLTLFERAPSEKNLRDFENNLEEGSYYEQKVRPVFQLARYYALRDLGEKALRGRGDGWYFYTPGVKYLTEPFYTELTEPPKDDPIGAIADFKRQLAQRGIKLLVMPVPGKATVHPERLVAGLEPRRELASHTRRVMNDLRQQGVEVIDLHRVFLDIRASKPEKVLYMRGDTHWTGEGARIAAETVAARVRQMVWYQQLPRQERYARREVTVSRRGDVPKMTRIPRQEQLFPLEKVTCYQIRFASGEDKGETYEEPDEYSDAPILVLGDSFSRVFETDEPEAAGWIANLAYELQTPVGSIVNDGGASTLVRQQLAQDLEQLEGKKLVVWAFVERDVRFGMQGWQKIKLWPDQTKSKN
jgi:hypothetical protein